MRTYARCLPCMLNQVMWAMNHANCGEDAVFHNLKTLASGFGEIQHTDSPAYNSSLAYHKIYSLIGTGDPYEAVRRQSNADAQAHFGYISKLVDDAPDKLYMAFRLAAIGNVIDFGVKNEYNIEKAISEGLLTDFARNDYGLFMDRLSMTDNVLMLADNSGEIVFDKLVVEQLNKMGKQVTYMVKGSPILNDAVMRDAVETGMTELTGVVDTGCNFMGFEECAVSPEAMDRFTKAGIVIAKGMANYETLFDRDFTKNKTFCVLKAKCDLVADDLHVELDDFVFAAL